DVVAILAVCGLLCAWLWQWPSWSLGLWAAAALLSREQNVLLVLGVAGVALWHRRWGTPVALTLALAVFAGWVVALRLTYGAGPLLPPEGNVAPRWWGVPVPFHGLWQRWTHLKLGEMGLIHLLGALTVTSQLILVVHLLWKGSDPVLVMTAVAGALLAL